MGMREKLIELLFNVPGYLMGTAELADYLIANGVTIPVRCKDCKHFDPEKALRPGGIWCVYWGTDPDPDDFCCKGERREGDG